MSNNGLSTAKEWAQSGTRFYPNERANKSPRLPGGVYRFVQPERQPWFLERTASEFEFPFKVYGAHTEVIQRILTHWQNTDNNLGILMNGLRGAGKTMTAQLLGNEMIHKFNIPILVVRDPIPLETVYNAVQQDLMIIFDEFEKTHDEDLFPGSQQQLLSTIDGMSRSGHRRMNLFTTNNTHINENFRDRPSRIHYKFEFERVADEVIEGLLDDTLPRELDHLRPEILTFLNTRSICTIDIVKATIAETVIFKQAPRDFEHMLNVAKGEPPSFKISILDPETNVVSSTITRYFRPDQYYQRWTQLMMGNRKAVEDFTLESQEVEIWARNWEGAYCVTLLGKCDEENTWLAKLRVPREKTVWKEFDFLEDESLLLDNRPRDWGLPASPSQAKRDAEARSQIEEKWYECENQGTVYGTGTPAVYKIRIEPNVGSKVPQRYRPTGAYSL